VKGQHLFVFDCIEDPVRQLDLTPEQTTVEALLSTDGRGVYQPEPINLFFVTRNDVRPDPRAFQPVKRIHKRDVFSTTGATVREN